MYKPKTLCASYMRIARQRIKEEVQKVYPSADLLKKRLQQIQGNESHIEYETCYKLAVEIFEKWYFDDIREFYLDCGYMSVYEFSHKRLMSDHYKRVAKVIMKNIHDFN